MNSLWRRNASCLVIVCLLLNLSVTAILFQHAVTQDHTQGANPGSTVDPGTTEEIIYPEEEWFEEIELPPELVINIQEDPNPNRPDLEFEDVKASWDAFKQKSYVPFPALDLKEVEYYKNISEVFEPDSAEWDLIGENGFVVMESDKFWQKNTFEDMYYNYWHYDLPVFITTDSILNTFHLLFDQFLQEAENKTLRPLLNEMTSELLKQASEVHDGVSDPTLKKNMKEIVIFFGVASRLLETGDPIPGFVVAEVESYVKKIMDAEVVEQYPGQDYTQYKPRGHYAGKPFLEKYFRAMMWYGRKSLDVNITDDVLQACLISMVILASEEAQKKWGTIYDITSYLVGESDSLNFFDILKAMYTTLGKWEIGLLASSSNVEKVQEELKKDEYYRQRIFSDVFFKDSSQANVKMVYPKIFQFMGQRYVPDSEIMQNVMYDRVLLYNGERRGLPSGLDVMAALGSSRAVDNLRSELEKYGYENELSEVWASVQMKTGDYWNQSAYFGLIRSYKDLISGEEGEEYPDFMRTGAWADEKLNSALGSWAELRHDTILYAKQPYSQGITCGTPDALVEPYPSFYERMERLSIMMRDIIVYNFDLSNEYATRFAEVFEDFADINYNLAQISERELSGEPLTPEESAFARGVYVRQYIGGGCGPPEPDGWLPLLIEKAAIDDKTMDTRIIADVATDPGTLIPKPTPPFVLHVGTGFVRSVVVALEMSDGGYSFFVGPVYSFYEFPLEGFSRLNDDEWKDLLDSNDCPPDPFWTSTFMA